MRYRNKKTGIEFSTNCVISGEDFEAIGQKKTETAEQPKTEKPKTTTKRAKK